MNEKGRNRREWIKSAAIIFLSVMLVLTFFSNTIMNYSLPQVAAQYIQSGTIAAQIRGAGVVESGDPYNVRVGAVRKVESIEVNVGDVVQKGDILMHLSYEDSEALKAAKAELEAAELAFEMALLTGNMDISVMQSAGKTFSLNTYKNNLIALKNEISLAEKEVTAAQALVDDLTQWGNALSTQISITPSNEADTSEEEKAVADIEQKIQTAELELEIAEIQRDEFDRKLNGMSVSSGNAEYDTLINQKAEAEQKMDTAKSTLAGLEIDLKRAQAALDKKLASGDTSDTIENLNVQKKQNELQLFLARNDLEAKQQVLSKKQTALSDYIKNISDSMNLSKLHQTITDAREKVDKLEQEVTGSEVKAPISGTITAINVRSGLDTPSDGIVVNMQPEGEGYTMKFSVTNEQARKVSVGEQASLVNSWRYDDLKVTLTRIMPDTTDPGRKKLLVFDVAGESVIAGQSLNVAVGQKSIHYDMLVPNSAIREDNNGKFVLIVESKSSPLGNRYKATRMDVEVIASDDTKSAISSALSGYEFVITTSTKPVESGQYVRLADN